MWRLPWTPACLSAKWTLWHHLCSTRLPSTSWGPCTNGGWVCVRARATPPKPVKTRHRRPRLTSIQTKTRNRILEPKHGFHTTEHMGGAHGGVPPHRCGSQASGPNALFDRPKRGSPVQSPCARCVCAGLPLYGRHTPTNSSPYIRLLCLLILRPVLAWPCLP